LQAAIRVASAAAGLVAIVATGIHSL